MLIVGNWKAYVDTRDKAKKLFATAKRLSISKRVKLIVAPPAPYIGMLAPGTRSKVGFAAQDISASTDGAATGETTGSILKNLGVSHVIIGHSERREQGESDALIVEKVKRALANGLTPILCVGERDRDPDSHYLFYLKDQIVSVLSKLSPKERLGIIIAYEPVWAIGKSAADAISGTELAEMVLYIKKVLQDLVPGKGNTKILYGGSVDPSNAREIAGGSRVDGFLVGRASTDSQTLSALVKALS
jgi:triosephosphate isomerase (TIM)